MRVAVLISGGGTTLRNLIDVRATGELRADLVQVISSNAQAAGNRLAVENNIPLSIVTFGCRNSLVQNETLFEICRAAQVELIVLGGFLKRLVVPPDFEQRVINIHPSLIPAFCGRGFYGMRVHQAVIDRGCKISGCSVHFVDNQYDHGPIIAQRAVDVYPSDTPQTLQQRVFEAECRLYPQVINWISAARVRVQGQTVICNELV